ncbi:MAG: hypothetical protein WBB28_07750 [Crinalium sp.]
MDDQIYSDLAALDSELLPPVFTPTLSNTKEVSKGELRRKFRAKLADFKAEFEHPKNPPAEWFAIGRWFRLGIGLFLLLSVLLSSCSAAGTVSWQKAEKAVSAQVLQEVVKQNTDLNQVPAPQTIASSMLAWTANGRGTKLVLFDFNNSGLCGAVGCLYTGYLTRKDQAPTQVFSSYLRPNLPPGKALFVAGQTSDNDLGLPCLEVTQPEKALLRQSSYCYNGSYYQLSRSRLLEMKVNNKNRV